MKPCKSTIIVIGVGRQAIDSLITDDNKFLFERVLPPPPEAHLYGLEEWKRKYWGCDGDADVGNYTDHHAKRVITMYTDTPPAPFIKALIAHYPHLRFVWYYKCENGLRGTIKGRDGQVQMEKITDEPEKFPVKN